VQSEPSIARLKCQCLVAWLVGWLVGNLVFGNVPIQKHFDELKEVMIMADTANITC
jgi:hypothetical protein